MSEGSKHPRDNDTQDYLSGLRQLLPPSLQSRIISQSSSLISQTYEAIPRDTSQRRVGEASDLHFLKIVRDVIGGTSEGADELPRSQELVNTYDQFDDSDPACFPAQILLPTRETGDKYVEVFFDTVQVAYPFIHKPHFMTQYQSFWEGKEPGRYYGSEDPSFYGLLCTFYSIVRLVLELILLRTRFLPLEITTCLCLKLLLLGQKSIGNFSR